MIQFKLESQEKKIMQKRKFATTFLVITLVAVMMIGLQMESVDAKKSKGTYNSQFGSATKHIVCGDRLCSESDTPKQAPTIVSESNSKTTTNTCSRSTIQMESSCSSFNINGGSVKGSAFDSTTGSTTIQIQAVNDGSITIRTALDSTFILVDGEEWDDVIVSGSSTIIEFLAGTEIIEIFGN